MIILSPAKKARALLFFFTGRLAPFRYIGTVPDRHIAHVF
jgi:hypothetical protein